MASGATQAIPPSIIGTIRWKSSLGHPRGDWCRGFHILVEERTAKVPDTGGQVVGDWEPIDKSPSCRVISADGEEYAISFQIPGLRLNVYPSAGYRVTPTVQGEWKPSGILAALYRRVFDPISAEFNLQAINHVQSVEFVMVRRRFFRWP